MTGCRYKEKKSTGNDYGKRKNKKPRATTTLFSYYDSISITHITFLFNIIATATSTAATVWWNALGNKLGMDSSLSESSTTENVEEIERGTRGNGDQEDIHYIDILLWRFILINIRLCYVLRI